MDIQSNQVSVTEAFKLLQSEGFPRAYVKKFLPPWWDNSLLKTSSGTFQFVLFVKQRLGLELKFDEQGKLYFADDPITARFKHRKDTHAGELSVVQNLGKAAASIASHSAPPLSELPTNPVELRDYILEKKKCSFIDFSILLEICWEHGIPVLFLDLVPTSARKMTGMVVNHAGTPVILLGFKHQHKSRQLFILAHELGHILLGHVNPNSLLIDEDLDSKFDTLDPAANTILDSEEFNADYFALSLIRGESVDSIGFDKTILSASELASNAIKIGIKAGIDPGHIILSYAFDTQDWPIANQAMKFFENANGALTLVKDKFFQYAKLSLLSEESKNHLLALQKFTEIDAP